MVKLAHVFYLIGAVLVGAAAFNLRDRRWVIAGFWAIVAAPFLLGDLILDAVKAGTQWPAQVMGGGVIALAVLASWARSRPSDLADERSREPAREASAARLRNWLFMPALAIPLFMILLLRGAGVLHWGSTALIDPAVPGQIGLIALGIASTLALIVALIVTRTHPIHGVGEARRLLDALSWAVVLPMTLATLGSVFDKAGVGAATTEIANAVLPTDSRFACLLAYALGMVVLTVIMGNAFAAFPVMTGGIGLPLLVMRHGADPATIGAMGMLTGYCGTLLTPMAANFNIVPARLLELRDPYGVIRAQWPTALVMIVANVILMSLFAFG
jgi:uncharacterized membrane protein